MAVATAPIGTLNERAMLVSLSISQWTAKKIDKKVGQEVAYQHGSDVNMGHYAKQLISREAIDKLTTINNAARVEHRRRTLAWLDGGTRILSSQGYFEYMQVMSQFKADSEAAAAEFLANYPTYYEDAKRALNGLFNESDYPNPSRLVERFSFNIDVLPLPASGDFRVDLGDEATALVQSRIESTMQATSRKAMEEVVGRIKEAVGHMADRLHTYARTPEGLQGNFKATLVTNVRDLASLIPTLNLTGDPALDEMARRLEEDLCQNEAEVLKEDNLVRQDTARRADAILSDLAAFIA